MKTRKTSILLLLAAVFGLVFAAPVAALGAGETPVSARETRALLLAPATSSVTATFVAGTLPAPLLIAQVETSDSGTPASGSLDSDSTAPWYMNGTLWTALIAFVAGAFAIWQNKEKRTAEKVSQTLVLAIEQASKIPEVVEEEKKIKAKIKEVTTKNGVEPIVNKLIDLLT